MAENKEKLQALLEQVKELGEEDKNILRKSLWKKREKKIEFDPKTYQTVYQIIQEIINFLEENKPTGAEKTEKELKPDLKISFSLQNQKKVDLTGELTKTLQIWWKDKGKLEKFKILNIQK